MAPEPTSAAGPRRAELTGARGDESRRGGDHSTAVPLTRAQRFQWFVEKGLVEAVRPLPEPLRDSTAEGSVRRVVRSLVERHEILRTSVEQVDGELRQRVHGAGPALAVVDLAPEEGAAQALSRLAGEYRRKRQGLVGDFLVRFYLLRSGDRGWLAMLADNVAVDANYHTVIDGELTELFAARTGQVPGATRQRGTDMQPVELARWEAGRNGQAERTDALRYLRGHFATAPARLHAAQHVGERPAGRYYRCTLGLDHADGLLARVMSSTDLVPSAVILAAFAQLLCWRSESDACVVNVSLDNRHSPELRSVLGATAQRTPVTCVPRDGSLIATAAGIQETLSQGYPAYGRYEPFDLFQERVRAQHRRGVCLTTDLAFNFVPPPQGWGALFSAAGGGPGPSPDMRTEVRCATTDETSYVYGASLTVRWSDSGSAELSVHGDTEVLPPTQCAALLRGIEAMLRSTAMGLDPAPDEVAGEVALGRRERLPHETRAGGRWIDLGAIRDRLLGMSDVRAVDVETVSRPAETARLMARVVVAEGSELTEFDLREALLEAVDVGEVLVTPDWYEIVGEARTGADRVEDATRRRGGDGHATERRPVRTSAEEAVRRALEKSQQVRDPDLDLCYVRAGGRLERYPAFADRLVERGYVPPGFALLSGMTTLRSVARNLVETPSPARNSRALR
ncbi:condensation domain-containing protein [Streptomyces sp. B6B3]|uniref:condensation domain-containing protein n=1 Tax=Streptomyces sp. B6B3 TaxID=3153570 RepID=UPI00325C7393